MSTTFDFWPQSTTPCASGIYKSAAAWYKEPSRRRTPKCQKIEDEIVDKARQEFSLKGEPCNFLLLANSRFTPIFECHIMHYTTVVDMSHLSEFKHLQFSWKCHNVNNRWKNLQAKQKKHHPLIMWLFLLTANINKGKDREVSQTKIQFTTYMQTMLHLHKYFATLSNSFQWHNEFKNLSYLA